MILYRPGGFFTIGFLLFLKKIRKMKVNVIVLFVLTILVSCKEVVKKEEKPLVEQKKEEVSFEKPLINDNLSIKSKDDFLGYWVGDFKANLYDAQKDTIYGNDKYSNLITRKITFSIDEIKNDSVFGHSVTAGNVSPFKGVLREHEGAFDMQVEEFRRTRTDGKFSIQLQKRDSVMKGFWTAFNPDSVKIGSRIFDLKKRLFKYNPENELEYSFYDTDKFRDYESSTDTVNGEEVVYMDQEYFATTQKIYEANPSTELLTKEFVSNLTKADIFILRNSIFAKHGFAFRSKQLRMYFEGFEWYMPVFSDVKKELTAIETQNIELLLRYEKNAEEYYDSFGR
ncbi:hypothetical protein DI487_11525 [Flavobacterium sediminis]|uniref:YARHG domain-containing protein n=2 Tax=Flavobacterium sediminis TaxID=2201181 RepID=A0A2U8QWB8_9FLAO|nr:hypothetical protein DI487_11525 [Flavobacterium sediminis]